ncbi:MAG: SPFH domain-containing protein [Planctomycetota bacterium]|nr:SPFH domain-containing protein [Planctomycetota bacterium]
MELVIIGPIVFVLLGGFALFWASRYKRCPSDKILVIYGKVATGKSSQCIHGGGKMVWPVIQGYSYLSLTPMGISIPLQNALSRQNIRISVPSTFTVGVSTHPGIMNNAAERLLGINQREIEGMAREIIFGQLRLTVASLSIEQINQDRESFLESIRKNVEPELNKIGLYLINVNITDITDESDYIESIGKKAASEAINQAKVDVAENDKMGAIGASEANRERTIRVAENAAKAEKGTKAARADQRVFVQQQEALAVKGENESNAEIAEYEALLSVKQAEARRQGEVAKRQAEVEIQKAQYLAETERLSADQIVKQEIDKRKIEIAAEAEAEKTRREAKGEADGILLKYEAEAKGIRQVLESKASGYEQMVNSTGGDARAAATLLMIEKIEDIVGKQVEAIQNLKIDKITVWDSAGGNGEGSSTANFVSSLIKALPPLHDIAGMAGVELPEYLGRMAEKSVSKTEEDGNDGGGRRRAQTSKQKPQS